MPCFLFLLLVLFAPLPVLGAEEASLPFDHSLWDQFLKKFVNEKGEVNYRAALGDPALLDGYLEKLKSFSTQSYSAWPREEKMALLINAYNAALIRSVLNHYPLKTPLAIPGGWEQSLVQIGHIPPEKEPPAGMTAAPASLEDQPTLTHSLNQIEEIFLRRGYRDEKALFGLCRASRSSPRLRQEAYTGPLLEGQLYLATREFVNDPGRNRIVPGEKKIVLSRIFQWYARDFLLNWSNFPEEIKWNPAEMAVLSFFAHYLQDLKQVEYLREAKYKVKYSIFDWALNDWNP